MKAVFVELPPFERHRAEYLDDPAFSSLQAALMADPESGDVIQRYWRLAQAAVRGSAASEGQARRPPDHLFLVEAGASVLVVYALYGKGEVDDLTGEQRKALKALLDHEVESRRRP